MFKMAREKATPQLTKKILTAVREIESRNLNRPYANINEIHKETKISRPTIYKYLEILKTNSLVFEVHGKGRGSWIQTCYAETVIGKYQNVLKEALKKDVDLYDFRENPKNINVDDPAFFENLNLVLWEDAKDLNKKMLADFEWLQSSRDNYFIAEKRNVFSRNPNSLLFAKEYGKLACDLEDTLSEWFVILCNKERYLESRHLTFLQKGFPVLSKIMCDIKALVHTANFICDNDLAEAMFCFGAGVSETLDGCAAELKRLIESF